MMLSAEILDKIEQDAAKATPGPWEATNWGGHHPAIGHYDHWFVDTSNAQADIYRNVDGDIAPNRPVFGNDQGPRDEFDMKHIANCDPQTVLELVKMARRYAWLRDGNEVGSTTYGEKMDAVIDQAIEGEKDTEAQRRADDIIASASGGDGNETMRRYTDGDDWNTKR